MPPTPPPESGPDLRLAVRTLAREEQTDLLCALLQSTDYGILMTDHAGADIVCNRRLGELFGLDPQQVVERPPESVRALVLTRVEDPRGFEERLEEIYREPDLVVEDEIRLKAPRPLILRRYTAPVTNDRGENVGRIWTFLDITLTRELQQRVEETAAALQVEVERRTAALRAISEVLDAMERILRAIGRGGGREPLLRAIAGSARRLFGFQCAAVLLREAEGEVLRGFIAPPRGAVRPVSIPVAEAAVLAPRAGAVDSSEPLGLSLHTGLLPPAITTLGCAAAAVVPLRIRGVEAGALVLGSQSLVPALPRHTCEHIEAVAGLVAVAIEVHQLQSEVQQAYSDLREAQQHLVQTEKLSAAGTLATSVAHDIRNIMAPLRLELEMASGADSETLAAARDQLDRLGVLTQRLLAFARPAASEREPVRVGPILEGVRTLLKAQAQIEGVEFILEDGTGGATVMADRAQLEQLGVNLALNAFAAMSPQGGCLRVTCAVEGACLRIRFADTGRGIPEADRDRIFEPFYSTRRSGTGLGLFSCRRIVEEHGGRIEVESVVGRGSCFSVFLPLLG